MNNKTREKTIRENMPLVHHVLKTKFNWTEGFKFRRNGKGTNVFTYDDLMQEGNIGLIRAVDNYDKDKGSFSNHAIIYITRRITWVLMERGFGLIRLPHSVHRAKRKLDDICNKKNTSYTELYQDGKISTRLYYTLMCYINTRIYEVIDEVEENENIQMGKDENIRKVLFEKEEKEVAVQLLWMATNTVFKENVNRNYHMCLWRAGLNGSDEPKKINEILDLIKKKHKSVITKQMAGQIISRIFEETKEIILSGDKNDFMR